jgi:transposase InsO family protein/transposase-like protein
MERRTKAGRAKRGSVRAERRRKLRDRGRRSTGTVAATGRRFTAEQKEHALTLVGSGGMTRERIASLVGTTTESLRHWVAKAKTSGTMPVAPQAAAAPRAQSVALQGSASQPRSPYAPQDPGQGLSAPETAAILEYKQRHPSMGPAQIRAQLKRFKGWRMSVKAIARALRAHGYEPVHRGSRPQGPEPQRFEAPRRNALWQMDFTDLRVDGEHLHLLVLQDDFSRYVVGHQLADSPETKVAIEVLTQAIARHGKPEAVRTDRGGAFTAGGFTRFLENELIDHVLGRAYHPQGGGKVESVIGTVKRELWEVEHFADRAAASRRLCEFFVHFNERRAHMGIDGLTPADRFFGRAEQVLATVDALSRKRQGAHVLLAPAAGQSEEILAARSGQPLEVLRLMIADGKMELRFCGARVLLGPLTT